MEEKSYTSPLDVFFNLKRYEDKSIIQLFMRMVNIYQEIPSNVKPPFYELFNKVYELGIVHDSQLYLLLKYVHDEIISLDNKCGVKSTEGAQEPNDASDSNIDKILD